MKPDYIVIGAGLFGSAIAKALIAKGEVVLIVDSRHPMAASKCSFGIWKDGWINQTIQPFVAAGMADLERIADGIKEVEFYNVEKDRIDIFKQIDCSKILVGKEDVLVGEVKDINKGNIVLDLPDGERIDVEYKKGVIVAAGAMTPHVLSLAEKATNIHEIDKNWGATLDLNIKLDGNRMSQWAPYRQSVLVKIGNHYSFGDGATVKNPKISDPRIEKASNRLLTHLEDILTVGIDPEKITAVNEGLRPYLKKGTTSFINQHAPWLWSATGGAKNSTILCTYVGNELVKHIGLA